jgi:hypothetical protein
MRAPRPLLDPLSAARGPALDPTAPFVVIPRQPRLQPHRGGVYHNGPDVIAQFRPGERQARFEAEWTDDGWKFGKRVTDV